MCISFRTFGADVTEPVDVRVTLTELEAFVRNDPESTAEAVAKIRRKPEGGAKYGVYVGVLVNMDKNNLTRVRRNG